MTNRTAHKLFKVFLDKNALGVAFGGAPAFLPLEEDMFLNLAQDEIISNKLTGNNALRVGFEGSPYRISLLDSLIRTDKELVATKSRFNEFVFFGVHNNGERMTIYNVMIRLGDKLSNCIIVDHNSAGLFKLTYNNIPWIETPVATLEDNQLFIYVDPLMMENGELAASNNKYLIDITYIKKPKLFNYEEPGEELDLPDDVMNEIVNRAVVLALENIESQRTNSKLQLNLLSE